MVVASAWSPQAAIIEPTARIVEALVKFVRSGLCWTARPTHPVLGGGFVLIYADITERKRAEEAIRAARDAAETALRDLQEAQASLVRRSAN